MKTEEENMLYIKKYSGFIISIVIGLLFGGKIEFKVACIGVAVVSFAAALIMIALDKKLSALVD